MAAASVAVPLAGQGTYERAVRQAEAKAAENHPTMRMNRLEAENKLMREQLQQLLKDQRLT